jgi:hypothetical protein
MMRRYDTAARVPWHYPRPDLAAAYLNAFDLKLSSARGLFARRRMGKTELLQHDLLPAARARGYLRAYTNPWDNRAAPDAALVSALAVPINLLQYRHDPTTNVVLDKVAIGLKLRHQPALRIPGR